MRDALAVHHVELGDAERRRDLVLHDLDPDPVADRLRAALDRLDAADVQAHRGVELERAAAGRRLRVAEHDADLLAQLVGEDERRVGAAHRARQLPQRLAHQPRLDADEAVAHLALDLRPRHEGRDGVHDDDVHAAGADERLGDLERLLAGVRLRDEELVHVDAAGTGRRPGSSACSTSMKAAIPPLRCASAMTCWQTVVLPDDSGPKISLIRPRGMPPTPSARSSAMDPVGIESTACRSPGAELHDRAAAELLLDREDRGVDRAPALGQRLLRHLRDSVPAVVGHRVLAPGGFSRPDGAGHGPSSAASALVGIRLAPGLALPS